MLLLLLFLSFVVIRVVWFVVSVVVAGGCCCCFLSLLLFFIKLFVSCCLTPLPQRVHSAADPVRLMQFATVASKILSTGIFFKGASNVLCVLFAACGLLFVVVAC